MSRSLITNLTCPGDSSLYVEWAQPEQFYHGVDRSEKTPCIYKQRHNDHVQVQHFHQDEAGRGLGSAGGHCSAGCQTQCGEGKGDIIAIVSMEYNPMCFMNRDLQSVE